MEELVQFTYQRNLNHTYLVYENVLNEYNYEIQMMINNRIPGLLKCHMQKVDGKVNLYYDISSKQQMEHVFEKIKMDYGLLKSLFYCIRSLLVQLEEYLLPSQYLMTVPQMIYMNPEQQKFYFCLVPQEKNTEMPFQKLLEFILEYVDYSDEKAVAAAYACYKRLNQENAAFREIYEEVFGERKVQEECESQKEETINKVFAETKREQPIEEDEMPLSDSEIFIDEETESLLGNFLKTARGIFEDKGLKMIVFIIIFAIVFILAVGSFYKVGKEKLFVAALVFLVIGVYVIKRRKQPQYAANEKLDFPMPLEDAYMVNSEDGCEEPSVFSGAEYAKSLIGKDTPESVSEKSAGREQIEKPIYGKTVFMENPTQTVMRRLEPSDTRFSAFLIQTYPFVIGKLEGAVDGIVQHETVSRIHCRIDYEEDRYYIVDLNSTNGTLVNGELLEGNEKREIHQGDVLGLGEAGFTFL